MDLLISCLNHRRLLAQWQVNRAQDKTKEIEKSMQDAATAFVETRNDLASKQNALVDAKLELTEAEKEVAQLKQKAENCQDKLKSLKIEHENTKKGLVDAQDRLVNLYSEVEILKKTHEQEEQTKLRNEFAQKSEMSHEMEIISSVKAYVRGPFEAQAYKIEELYGDLKTKK